MFEVAGSLNDFYSQVQRIPGLEFLLQENVDFEPSDDFYLVQKRRGETLRSDAPFGGRLYMAMPDLRALRQILSLWDPHQAGQQMPSGFAPWGRLFELLIDLRAWGPQDRVLPETLEYRRQRLESNPTSPIRFELELWFYEQIARRQQASTKINRQVDAIGGQVISQSEISVIRYSGMLVDLLPDRVQEMLTDPRIGLASVDGIMYLHPQSIASFPSTDDSGDIDAVGDVTGMPGSPGEPIAALLDGVPVENHLFLRNRLTIDDPDDFASRAPLNSREHGTSMASLILHGDLQSTEQPLSRSLIVRPVMVYDANTQSETTPPDKLPLDIIYQAVRRLLEGDAFAPATAPTVAIINLSLGDLNRPYAGRISPWLDSLTGSLIVSGCFFL